MSGKVLKDPWFQIFAAVGGAAYLISLLGGPTARHEADPAPPAEAAPVAAAPAAAAAPAPAVPITSPEEIITPTTGRDPSSLVMGPSTTPPPVAAPAAPPDAAPAPAPAPAPGKAPQITLTGAGVGNKQGLPAPPAMGGLAGLLGGLMGVPQGQPQAVARMAAGRPPAWVKPAKAGLIVVGPPGTPGADTSSVRDAVYSASSGDLITVKAGNYDDGPIEIENKSVRIRGEGAKTVIGMEGRPGATISVRNGSLDLESLAVTRAAFNEFTKSSPSGAVYASGSTLSMRRVELTSMEISSPPLIVEQGEKPTRVTMEDSELIDSKVSVIARGPVKMKFKRVRFRMYYDFPLAAWLDASAELEDCTFQSNQAGETVIVAYEGARVTVTGKQKPRISTTRGVEATVIEESFGAKKQRGLAKGAGFARDIFRRGRKRGALP